MDRTTQMILLTERVDDLTVPHVSSSQKPCSSCGAAVWVDLAMIPFAPTARIVCRTCLTDELDDAKWAPEDEIERARRLIG